MICRVLLEPRSPSFIQGACAYTSNIIGSEPPALIAFLLQLSQSPNFSSRKKPLAWYRGPIIPSLRQLPRLKTCIIMVTLLTPTCVEGLRFLFCCDVQGARALGDAPLFSSQSARTFGFNYELSASLPILCQLLFEPNQFHSEAVSRSLSPRRI